mgnify:CR=1 FL=1
MFQYKLPKLTYHFQRPLGEIARDTMDWRLAKLDKEVRFCKRCVVSNQRPNIVFDEEGICAPCRFAERKVETDWAERKRAFEDLLDRYRSKDGSNDVIVPFSGGKDSGSIAHKLKYQYGMNPLCVTWAPMLYTDIGWTNLQNSIQAGFDHVLLTPNPILHRKLSLLAFTKFGAHFYAFGRGQVAAPFHVAAERNIKLVMFAENGEAEYGGYLDYAKRSSLTRNEFKKFYHAGLTMENTIRAGLEEGFFEKSEIKPNSFHYYTAPPMEVFEEMQIAMSWFYYFHKNIPQENYYYCSEHMNFQANPGRSEGTYSKYASLDDRTDGFHYYMAFIKFGIGRTTADAAHEVRDGHISREEAIALVRKYDGEFPKKYFADFLDYLGISEQEFNDIVDAYRQDHIWTRENDAWKLKHVVS